MITVPVYHTLYVTLTDGSGRCYLCCLRLSLDLHACCMTYICSLHIKC